MFFIFFENYWTCKFSFIFYKKKQFWEEQNIKTQGSGNEFFDKKAGWLEVSPRRNIEENCSDLIQVWKWAAQNFSSLVFWSIRTPSLSVGIESCRYLSKFTSTKHKTGFRKPCFGESQPTDSENVFVSVFWSTSRTKTHEPLKKRRENCQNKTRTVFEMLRTQCETEVVRWANRISHLFPNSSDPNQAPKISYDDSPTPNSQWRSRIYSFFFQPRFFF